MQLWNDMRATNANFGNKMFISESTVYVRERNRVIAPPPLNNEGLKYKYGTHQEPC